MNVSLFYTITDYSIDPYFSFSTVLAISFSLSDSTGPVLFTMLWNIEYCFCKRLNGVSNSITLPDDKTYKINLKSSTQLFTTILTHQYSIRVHYCFQSVSNSKDSTIIELLANHLLNYTICSVFNKLLSCTLHITLNLH